jgi:hypothetical protein
MYMNIIYGWESIYNSGGRYIAFNSYRESLGVLSLSLVNIHVFITSPSTYYYTT